MFEVSSSIAKGLARISWRDLWDVEVFGSCLSVVRRHNRVVRGRRSNGNGMVSILDLCSRYAALDLELVAKDRIRIRAAEDDQPELSIYLIVCENAQGNFCAS